MSATHIGQAEIANVVVELEVGCFPANIGDAVSVGCR